jgi:hypothetical protein
MLCSETQFIFHLLHKSLAARPRLTQTSDRLVARCLRSILLRPTQDGPFEIVTTMGEVMCQTRPGRGTKWRLARGAAFLPLDRAFRYQKAASKSLYRSHIEDLDQEINRLR